MSVPVDADAPAPPTPEAVPPRERESAPAPASHPVPRRGAREAALAVCPYLASEGGSWRSAEPSRDHRCTAVDPPASQTTEKQRRHCLASGHVECTLYRAARTARATSLAAGADPQLVEVADRRRRAVARTAPVVLEGPRLVDGAMRLEFDRAPGQVALVALMLVAFAVVAVARFSAAGNGPSPAPSTLASIATVASPSASAAPSATPVLPSPSVVPSAKPTATPKPEPSFRTTYKVKSGDTLIGIASKYHTTPAKIRALNGLKSSTLKIGQVLKIP